MQGWSVTGALSAPTELAVNADRSKFNASGLAKIDSTNTLGSVALFLEDFPSNSLTQPCFQERNKMAECSVVCGVLWDWGHGHIPSLCFSFSYHISVNFFAILE